METETVTKNSLCQISVEEARKHLQKLSPLERLEWAYEEFGSNFIITTSFGIQSAVLLHMNHLLKSSKKIKVVWIDTGYLPPQTYLYAEQLTNKFQVDLEVIQSKISPARMEALYGKLWETGQVEDLEKYHAIRKVEPLEQALQNLKVNCWASGVRGGQTDHRRSMTVLDTIRNRFSLRPILEWTKKDVFYYMQSHNLPQHPLFEKGYSTVGDWHSSGPDSIENDGRSTRFSGLKQECGIHLSEDIKEGD